MGTPAGFPASLTEVLESSRRRLPSESAAHLPTPSPTPAPGSFPGRPSRWFQSSTSIPEGSFFVTPRKPCRPLGATGPWFPPAPPEGGSLLAGSSLLHPRPLPTLGQAMAASAPESSASLFLIHRVPGGPSFLIGSFLSSSRAAPTPSCCVLPSHYPLVVNPLLLVNESYYTSPFKLTCGFCLLTSPD